MTRNSISSRLALVMVLIVTLTALAASALIFSRLNSVLIESTSAELERETEIQATKFVSRMDELMRDTLLLANTPPIQGIIRSSSAGADGLDATDGSTLALWRRRLEIIFEGVIRNKPDYLQVRFIGLADGGRELVRVDRDVEAGQVLPIGDQSLQQKGLEPYFTSAIRKEEGQIDLSPINLNREQGVIEEPYVPVIRSSTPIFNEVTGEVFGIVVINLAVNSALRELTTSVDPRQTYYVVDADNHYLVHPQRSREFEFEQGIEAEAQDDFPLLRELMKTGGAALSTVDAENKQVLSSRKIRFGPAESARSLYVVVTDGFQDITVVSRAVAKQAAVLIIALAGGAFVIGIILARRIVQPIEKLAESVRNLDVDNAALSIPPALPAEAGELAHALESSLEAVSKRNEQLLAKNKELEQFAYIASHDLQEPVRTISSFSTMLNTRYADQLDERGHKSLTFILDSCQRMQALIHGLLEYSRLGKKAEPEDVDLASMIQGVLDDLHASIESKQARITVASLPTLHVYAVEVRLLFQNLLGNALKFTHPDVKPAISIDASRSGRGWQFAVTDNGLGIAPEAREKVFLIFQRLQNRNEYEGTGIGLAHCRKIVEMHGGNIWIEDAPGGGSRFVFTLHELARVAPQGIKHG